MGEASCSSRLQHTMPGVFVQLLNQCVTRTVDRPIRRCVWSPEAMVDRLQGYLRPTRGLPRANMQLDLRHISRVLTPELTAHTKPAQPRGSSYTRTEVFLLLLGTPARCLLFASSKMTNANGSLYSEPPVTRMRISSGRPPKDPGPNILPSQASLSLQSLCV